MTVAANAQQAEIRSTEGLDLRFIGCRVARHGLRRQVAARHMSVGRIDIDVVEQLTLHEEAVAFGMIPGEAVVLIEIERHHMFETEAPGAVLGDPTGVHGAWRPAGGQDQDAPPTSGSSGADDVGNVIGHPRRCRLSIWGK